MGKKKTDFYTFLVFRKDCFPTDEESDSEKKKNLRQSKCDGELWALSRRAH